MIEVDLHITKHLEARNIVIRKIEEYWNTNETLCFITGKSSAMKLIVMKVAEEYKLKTNGDDMVDLGYVVVYL